MKIKAKIFFLSALWLLLLTATPAYASKWLECSALMDEKSYEGREALKHLVPGKQGWIFISKKDFKQDFELNAETLIELKNFQTALKKKGTELVLVVVPPRGLIHSDKIDFSYPLAKNYNNLKAQESYAVMTQQLQKNNFVVVNPLNFLSLKEYGYERDHHWNAVGAKTIADLTAEKIKKLSAYNKIKKENFLIEEGKVIEFKGSFYNPIKEICNIELPSHNIKETVSISSNKDFFTNALSSVTLVGTSFSEEGKSKANFAGHLRVALSMNIDNQSLGGGGISKSIIAYLKSEDFKNKPANILVWEIPGFYSLNRPKLYQELTQVINN